MSGIAIASGIPRPGVSVVDDDCLNAFTVPLTGGTVRLCLTSGLIEALNLEELTSVVAHEYAHINDSDLDGFHVTLLLLSLLWKKRLRQREWGRSSADCCSRCCGGDDYGSNRRRPASG